MYRIRFIYLFVWLSWVSITEHGVLTAAQEASPVAVVGFLTAIASLVVKHGLYGTRASGAVAGGL